MMNDAIKNFPKQFEYEPKIENADKLGKFSKFVVVGMGGSHLAADLLKIWKPELELLVHKDYGLPVGIRKDILVVSSSYSGNTEEVLDAYDKAIEQGFAVAVMCVGGKLMERAKEHGVPYIKLPDTGIQPRSALGFMFRALLALMGESEALKETYNLQLDADGLEIQGKELAGELRGKVPIIYSSKRNEAIAQNWKIKFNETGKIPAFYNVFPELNHNEMAGFSVEGGFAESDSAGTFDGAAESDSAGTFDGAAESDSAGTFDGAASGGDISPASLARVFAFIFLRDDLDHPQIKKRMEVTKNLYEARELPVIDIELKGDNIFYKIFSSLILADWTAYYSGINYGVETERVPMVEELKKFI